MTKENGHYTSIDEPVSVNREYASDVFKMYFSIRENALELYNAMNGTDYKDPNDLTINTLENGIFLKIYNDVSFVICGTVNLYEHQSTVNPNMPFRALMYITDLLKPTVVKNDIYGKRLIKMSTPKFAVFYNGTEEAPECDILKLSDAFIQPTDDPELELVVKVLNINYGHNKELMDRCVALRDYATLQQRIRDNLKEGKEIETAATEAVDSCIRDHIMEDFLIREKAGVIKMHVLDFNEELHNESLKEEGREIGFKEGVEKGIEKGMEKGQSLIALNMLRDGMDFSVVSKYTGIPTEKLKELEKA